MKISAKTDTGIVRETNQDTFEYAELPDGVCFAVVCDGMGGPAGGNIASATAAGVIADILRRSYDDGGFADASLEKLLMDAISDANADVFAKSRGDDALSGMGTTVAAVIVLDKTAYIAHVGDSRIYLASNGALRLLTHDHSYVQVLVDSGYISEDEALTHPKRNMITRALGIEGDVLPDFTRVALEKGDVLLLCTDGLTNYVTKDLILANLLDEDFDACAGRLVELANSNGGGDNITAVCIKF